ncbi:MAG: hypothetical protein QMC36_03265 [Patescibacteria group bacterium]
MNGTTDEAVGTETVSTIFPSCARRIAHGQTDGEAILKEPEADTQSNETSAHEADNPDESVTVTVPSAHEENVIS